MSSLAPRSALLLLTALLTASCDSVSSPRAPAASGAASADDLVGVATVIDGDTLEIRSLRIRLHGIDAPESNQSCTRPDGSQWRCGQQASLALSDHVGRQTVRCEVRDVDRYGRTVAECFVGGASMNQWMVASGWAVAYRTYSRAFIADENRAHAARLNIWSGSFDMPWDFRKQPRRDAPARATRPSSTLPPDPACPIKGNINGRGERIFHSPGQRDYEATVIDIGAGERWFCSAQDAQEAGWRPSMR